MEKKVNMSGELYMWTRGESVAGESIDATLRRLLGLAPRRRKNALTRQAMDRRKKYPILDMAINSELTMPWIIDKQTGLPVSGAMRGLNSCISRCNRIKGRLYRSTVTPSGVHVARLA